MTRNEYGRLILKSLAAVVLIGLLVVVGQIKTTVHKQGNSILLQQQLSLNGRQSRIEFQARQTFLLCSRKATLVNATVAAEVKRACADYRTLAQAVATEARHSPIPNRKP